MEFTIMQVGSKRWRLFGGAYRNLHNLFDKHMPHVSIHAPLGA
ncbi:hypothetical protein BSU04_07120 [Caballeronia sordidicola]|jgi:hypothetical protein|uniref:Uncharacterized protein n=1 Tax=Caballeronia sordidicola TaxID=196367 RepID=A0A226WUA5_CABSO|nr:hypothetical protein BSU04_30150 [Caballeronia sordidicola]OXC79446.1 hypothetical protein BSU04_07120 [Caballeronia sordidicola]